MDRNCDLSQPDALARARQCVRSSLTRRVAISVAIREGQRANEIMIADNGEAKLQIDISALADETVRNTAADLGRYLERISRAPLSIAEGTGDKGLVLGVPKNLPDLPWETEFGDGPFERDH